MTHNLKNIFYKLNALFHRAGALRIVFFAVLFFSGMSLFAQTAEYPAERTFPRNGNTYSGLLTVNRDCEAPALRCRLGQQLQLNFRSARQGQPWNLQRTGHTEGKLLPDFCRQTIAGNSLKNCQIRENSTYPVYSTFSFPVRAGPQFSTTEQSFSV
ncbi:MAG: hypothetical protein IKA32_11470 [Lentisphaeria bacterium]|nr:hypothetical protein [Lentisphaeria bacterium]